MEYWKYLCGCTAIADYDSCKLFDMQYACHSPGTDSFTFKFCMIRHTQGMLD